MSSRNFCTVREAGDSGNLKGVKPLAEVLPCVGLLDICLGPLSKWTYLAVDNKPFDPVPSNELASELVAVVQRKIRSSWLSVE